MKRHDISDYMIRATALEGKIRAFGILSTKTVNEIQKRQDTYPVVTAAVGRVVTITAIMGWMLKGDDKLTVQVKGGGPIGQIVADADAFGNVRAYVTEPHVDLPLNAIGKLDVSRAVGTDGFLHVIKDMGLREPYRGSVPIVSGEIGEDFTYYFTQSEQTPSAVGVGVLVAPDYSVEVAGGFVIQLMPGVSDEEIAEIEAAISNIQNVTGLLREGNSPEDILRQLIPGDVLIHEKTPVSFTCTCNKPRLERVLISLGESEILEIVEEQGQAELTCSFCRDTYHFSKEELLHLVDQIRDVIGTD